MYESEYEEDKTYKKKKCVLKDHLGLPLFYLPWTFTPSRFSILLWFQLRELSLSTYN